MVMKEFLSKLGMNKEINDGLPDDVTRDNVLKGLRRQRRVQLEENEKIKLKQQIAEFNRQRTSKNLFGKFEQKDMFIEKKKKPRKQVKFTENSMMRKSKFLNKSKMFK